jgi:hypothetical protein
MAASRAWPPAGGGLATGARGSSASNTPPGAGEHTPMARPGAFRYHAGQGRTARHRAPRHPRSSNHTCCARAVCLHAARLLPQATGDRTAARTKQQRRTQQQALVPVAHAGRLGDTHISAHALTRTHTHTCAQPNTQPAPISCSTRGSSRRAASTLPQQPRQRQRRHRRQQQQQQQQQQQPRQTTAGAQKGRKNTRIPVARITVIQ